MLSARHGQIPRPTGTATPVGGRHHAKKVPVFLGAFSIDAVRNGDIRFCPRNESRAITRVREALLTERAARWHGGRRPVEKPPVSRRRTNVRVQDAEHTS
jgi:hypothetical protein